MPCPFTLAHITDLHLGPLPRLGLADLNVKRGLGAINWWRKRRHIHVRAAFDRILAAVHAANPDHIAVTGDLVNIGLPAEHARAVALLEAIGPPDRVSVVPGNHDIYCPLWRDPGVGRWQAYMTGDGPAAELTFPYLRRRGRIALIGVNSAVPTPPGIAQGEVGAAQIQALAVLLRQTGAEGLCRVVMIHHPPLAMQAPPRRRLRDGDAFAEVLRQEGAELVLHGHNHIDEFTTLETTSGQVTIVGVGSASAARRHHREPAARAALYRITPGPGLGWSAELQRLGLGHDGHAVSVLEHQTLEIARG